MGVKKYQGVNEGGSLWVKVKSWLLDFMTTSYKKRTSVERVNSRLDVSFGFEKHYTRGLKEMRIRCGRALCVMLAMALDRNQEKQDLMRSLVKSA